MNILKIYVVSLILFIPLSAQAFSLDDLGAQIINKVNVSANTGGNSAEPGEVIEGKSEVKVHIESNINGETVEPIDIEVQSEDEEAKVKVEQKITYPDEQGQPKVEQNIEINEEVPTDSVGIEPVSIEVNISKEPIEEPIKVFQLTSKISQWWSSFWGGLKVKLANIVGFWKK